MSRLCRKIRDANLRSGLWRIWAFAGLAALGAACSGGSAEAQEEIDPFALSPEQLLNATVTSVSKTDQALRDAPAAIYVISHDDVMRSGATSIAEMLRLAPNLEVMQTSASGYVVTARGFNGSSAVQNFSNKLLVLIDGRSVYTPLYSGVYWDMQDVLPEDIERIEVVSGPGGTLWGANAVNGVINILTRKSAETSGGLLDLGAGDQEASAAIQYGGKLDDNMDYRVYAKTFFRQPLEVKSGAGVGDGWGKPQGGFRLDWTPGQDQVSLSGDIYGGVQSQPGTADQDISGGNLTLNWRHLLADGTALQILTYYDQTRRSVPAAAGFVINTYDVEVQHGFDLGRWNSIVWGAGDRIHQYRIADLVTPASSLLWRPGNRTLNLANVFAEDHIALSDTVQLSIGLKLEDDPYSGISPMPSGRLSWKAGGSDLLWAAVSRAVRAPSPFDTDVLELLGTVPFITGNPNFQPEQVTAYELGYRGQLLPSLTVSLSLFENVYSDLRSVEPTIPTLLPLYWGNGMEADVHGVEAWASYQVNDWWRLNAGFNLQHEDLKFAPGASKLLGISQAGDDPNHQAQLRSTMNLMDGLTLDADLRDVGQLPDPKVPEYVELNARLGWRASETLELSLSGFNLLHARHLEYVTSAGDEVRRNFFVETRWRF